MITIIPLPLFFALALYLILSKIRFFAFIDFYYLCKRKRSLIETRDTFMKVLGNIVWLIFGGFGFAVWLFRFLIVADDSHRRLSVGYDALQADGIGTLRQVLL